MKKLPTYNEILYNSASRIFEAEDIEGLTSQEINEAEQAYDTILEKIQKGEEIEEGFLGGLIGGAAGALIGPSIGKAICKALGIDQKGTLGKLLTSRLVTTAIGIAIAR